MNGPFEGLVADVKHYAGLVGGQVFELVGNLYPSLPRGANFIAWLWAWTAKCSNPACGAPLPLVSSMWLSKNKKVPYALRANASRDGIRFDIGRAPDPIEGTVSRAGAVCLVCGSTSKLDSIRDHAARFGLGRQMLCGVVDDGGIRTFVGSDEVPTIEPDGRLDLDFPLPDKALGFRVQAYGVRSQRDLYLPRQLATLESFASAIADVPRQVGADGGDELYGKTIASILGLALGKLAQSNSTQVRWNVRSSGSSKAEPAFGRHAMPMVWDFVETNPFGGSVGDWLGQIESISRGIRSLPESGPPARVTKADARSASHVVAGSSIVVTDPPYFDQIGYADLSDYFYVWHRKALRDVHPDLYQTILTPKDEELIATPYRHDGNGEMAASYFIEGFTQTFKSLRAAVSDEYPLLIVYAHRQEEKSSFGSASTGWDAMLEAVMNAGLAIEATLPVHGAYKAKLIGIGTNALASYVVMVCRPREGKTAPATIADFRAALRRRLPTSVDALLKTGESMVDIRQAAIGPGMEVFSQYSQVFDGNQPIRVRRALSIINEELGRLLDEHLGVVDDETRWACQWYADHCFDAGAYDLGRKLAAVYGLGVDGLKDAGIVESGRGTVRLLRRDELPRDWNGDARTPVWEACQHLVKRVSDGEETAGRLTATLGARAAGVRELAQFLTNLAIEKGWSDEAIAYDALVKSWPRIEELSRQADSDESRLFEVGGNG
jgi:putative DNA methylase